MCTDDSTNIVWAGQIPPGLIAVRFTIGLRSYQGFVKEADFKEADFSDRSPPVSGGTEKASYESLLMGLIREDCRMVSSCNIRTRILGTYSRTPPQTKSSTRRNERSARKGRDVKEADKQELLYSQCPWRIQHSKGAGVADRGRRCRLRWCFGRDVPLRSRAGRNDLGDAPAPKSLLVRARMPLP